MAQLALDLGHRPALGREDFLVAPSNEVAVAWIDRWATKPWPMLAIHGPAGSGKSHLVRVWQSQSQARLLAHGELDGLDPLALTAGSPALALDDADAALAADPARQEALLHLYNAVVERRGHLLLTARAAPRDWPVTLPDLRSRLRAVQTARLGMPDEALIEALLVKLFADRQIAVPAEVVRYLLPRIERSFAAVRDLVDRLDRAALGAKRAITVPLARAVLEGDATRDEDKRNEGRGEPWISD